MFLFQFTPQCSPQKPDYFNQNRRQSTAPCKTASRFHFPSNTATFLNKLFLFISTFKAELFQLKVVSHGLLSPQYCHPKIRSSIRSSTLQHKTCQLNLPRTKMTSKNSLFPLSIRANKLAVIITLIMYPLVESYRADKTGLDQLHRSKPNFFSPSIMFEFSLLTERSSIPVTTHWCIETFIRRKIQSRYLPQG